MPRTHFHLLTLATGCGILLGMAASSKADTPGGYSGAAGRPYGGASAPYAPAYPSGYSYSPYPSSPYATQYPGSSFSSAPASAYPPLPTRKAYVRVFLPDDRAKVTLDGQETSATGASRLFETPPLPVDQTYTYTYTLKATWKQNGRPVTQERRVVVVPGQYAVANFLLPAHAEALPAPNSSESRSYP